MASASVLKNKIKDRVKNSEGSTYSDWTIGITNEPANRKGDHNNPPYWNQWKADSLSAAQEVEDHFLNEFPSDKKKRMKGGTGGDLDPNEDVYVYIF